MKLYYSKGACSLAVRIMIHEMNLPCQFEAVNLKTKRTETDQDFLKINPKGSVPALLLDNDEILTENVVIQQYLADKNHATSLLPPIGDLMRYRVLEWLNFISTDLHKTCGPLFNPKLSEHSRNEIFVPALKNKLNFVDHHLSHNRYLMNEQFTLADGYLFVILSWLKIFQLDLADWPNALRYFNELKQRKSLQQALKEERLD